MLRTHVMGVREGEGTLRRPETADVTVAEESDAPPISGDGHRRATEHSVEERGYERQERPGAYEPLDVFYRVRGPGTDENPTPPKMGGG